MRGFFARLLRLVGGWLDEVSGLGGFLERIWDVAGIFLDSAWGPIWLVPALVGLLAVTPRLRRWLRRSLANTPEGARLSLVPRAPFPDPISPECLRIVGVWLVGSVTVAIGTFLVIDGRDSLVALMAFSLALGGITFLGFWINFMLFGGAWHLTFDDEGVHAVARWKRRSLGWESIEGVGVRGHRLRISVQGDDSDLICWGFRREAARRVAGQVMQCLETLQPPGEALHEDTQREPVSLPSTRG